MANVALETAIQLAGAGVPVFTCNPDKTPRGKWRDISSIDPAKIEDDFAKHPEALYGIDLGKVGLTVVDLDRKNGKDGVAIFAKWCDENEYPEGSVVVRTPSGGYHFYFRTPLGVKFKNSVDQVAKGIDIRSTGGYVIGPNSVLPDGVCYETAEGSPDLVEAFSSATIPDVPPWLAELILSADQDNRKPETAQQTQTDHTSPNGPEKLAGDSSQNERAYALKALEENASELAACSKGGRNDLLNAKAFRMGRMAARGWVSRSEVESSFTQAMQTNGYISEHGHPATRATFNSGWRAGLADPHDDLPTRERESERTSMASEAIERVLTKSAADRARFEEYKRIQVALSRGAALEQQQDGSIADAETGEIIVDGADMRPGESPSDRLARKAREWRDRIEGNASGGTDQPKAGRSEKVVELETVNAATLAGEPVPEMRWHVDDMIPAGNVTLLSGDGATGKSLLALQLAVATATGGNWIGFQPAVGRVVYVSAEDEIEELHRRLARMVPNLEKLGYLTLVPLAGKDAVLAAPSGKDGLLKPTEIYAALRRVVEHHHADFLVLDTLADLFGGDELKKVHARQFIGMLRGMALDLDCTIVLLSHPSQSGMASGDGTSGNVAWNNSVRSRLYFERRLTRENGRTLEDDRDIRILTVKKNNRAPNGGLIVVRYDRGQFVRENGLDLSAADTARESERVFIRLLEQFEREGRHVSPSTSPTYAPSVFAKHPESGGFGKSALEKAMNRLLTNGRIKIEAFGPPSRQRQRLYAVQNSEGYATESYGGADE